MTLSRRLALGGVAACAVGALQRPARASTSRLRLSGAYGDALFHGRNLRAFASQAASLSRGSLDIEVVPDGRLKPMDQVLPALQRQELAFGEVLMSACASQHALLGIDALPFIVRSFEDAQHLWEATREAVQQQLGERGVRVLYAVPWPAQGLFCRHPVGRLQDLKGLRLRVYDETTQRLAELVGAHAVTVAAADLPRAVADGRLDAMFTSSSTGVDCQAWSSMSTFIDLRAWIPKNMVCASDAVWRGLPDPARAALLQAARQAESSGWQLARQADEAAKQQLTAHRMTVEPPSAELRRPLDLMGERFGRETAHKAGMDYTRALLAYYTRRG
ncbi:TRAP transporter substrate-binding protein [Eleftheria terrae]|uniref:TRAP transporter substrate-binding protein n=1 Tax=Eleftheria terrae TaxID=1597781 RepID=UPI00263AE197|nr:TRAP transporter substrate-binding protein [Eleftheria terrae]WKB53426.1 TRAP transporter substrate-binding protein [Eleftheria terrae]